MSEQVAVAAEIRAGKREQRPGGWPRARLSTWPHGFTGHRAFLGERTVVLVFEGQGALEHVQDLRRMLPMAELARMGMLIRDPQLLSDQFSWEAASAGSA